MKDPKLLEFQTVMEDFLFEPIYKKTPTRVRRKLESLGHTFVKENAEGQHLFVYHNVIDSEGNPMYTFPHPRTNPLVSVSIYHLDASMGLQGLFCYQLII